MILEKYCSNDLIVFNSSLLQKYGLKTIYLRNPNSFTPLLDSNKYLLLGNNVKENKKEIAKFSRKDAEVIKMMALLEARQDPSTCNYCQIKVLLSPLLVSKSWFTFQVDINIVLNFVL